MSRLYYTASNYQTPYDTLNTTDEENINCSRLTLCRAMITVGNPSFFTWKQINTYGFYRALSTSILEKADLIFTNIQNGAQGICLHPIYNSYISDKKRSVSYNLGMSVAKIYAERLLGIPNLIHVESLKKQGAIRFTNSTGRSKEPDLIGQTANGEWHVFEAKGTSSIQLASKVREAKNQARQIDTIHGVNPSTISACATYFGLNKIISRIEDPPSEGSKSIEVETDKFYENYYAPYFAINESFSNNIDKLKVEKEYTTYNLKGRDFNIRIGLESEIIDFLKSKNYDGLSQYLSLGRSDLNTLNQESELISIGRDGFVVELL